MGESITLSLIHICLPTLETFNALDPSEIESISVLRDASAAIYGSRASQGAITVSYTHLGYLLHYGIAFGMHGRVVQRILRLWDTQEPCALLKRFRSHPGYFQ